VPVGSANWTKFTQGLRSAGLAAYKAAQKKHQDAMVDATAAVADACAACHEVYRDHGLGAADRCS
jgi:cytochrome c556